jgi:hypothetical protein
VLCVDTAPASELHASAPDFSLRTPGGRFEYFPLVPWPKTGRAALFFYRGELAGCNASRMRTQRNRRSELWPS